MSVPPEFSYSAYGANRRGSPRRKEDIRLLQHAKELDAARRVCETLFFETIGERLHEHTLRIALEAVEAEAGSLLLADPQTKQLIFSHVVGEKADVLRGTGIPWDKGLAGAVFESGRAEIVTDTAHDQRHFKEVDTMTGFHTRDMIVLPLQMWGKPPIGVLEIMNKRNGTLGQEDLCILTILSALSTAAIEQARLFEEAKLAQVVRLVGEISQEMKNLLTPIVMSTQILERGSERLFGNQPAASEQEIQSIRRLCRQSVSTLHESTRHIQDRILEVSDCVTGMTVPLHATPCKLADIAQNVFKVLGVVAADKGIDLKTEGLTSLPAIIADQRRIYSALYSLVNNSIPDVPPGGAITIRGGLDEAAGLVMLSVHDTGRSLSKEAREQLFSGKPATRKMRGTGLGAKIVKDAVEAHGGRIAVESGEGNGTTVRISLPTKPSSATT